MTGMRTHTHTHCREQTYKNSAIHSQYSNVYPLKKWKSFKMKWWFIQASKQTLLLQNRFWCPHCVGSVCIYELPLLFDFSSFAQRFLGLVWIILIKNLMKAHLKLCEVTRWLKNPSFSLHSAYSCDIYSDVCMFCYQSLNIYVRLQCRILNLQSSQHSLLFVLRVRSTWRLSMLAGDRQRLYVWSDKHEARWEDELWLTFHLFVCVTFCECACSVYNAQQRTYFIW